MNRSERKWLLARALVSSLAACVAGAGCDLAEEEEQLSEVEEHRQEIVGGVIVSPGEFPFAAAIDMVAFGYRSECTGSLVTPTLVLTAAHCVYNSTRTGLSLPSDFRVILGRRQLSDTSTGTVHTVSEVIKHPQYTHYSTGYDVAFLRLATASSLPTVEIASPYGPSDRALWFPGTTTTTIGYGATYEGDTSNSDWLRKVGVPIVDDNVAAAADWYGSAFRRETMVAAGFAAGGRDSCQGDSGGPLLSPSRNGWKVVGVTSWGEGCARPKKPGVYSRISEMRMHRWVKAVVHETPHVGDVNGDGRDDIVTFTHGDSAAGPLDVYVALSTGASFGAASLWNGWWAHRQHVPMLGDFNGDGKDDIFAFTEVGNAWVALSTGTSFNGSMYTSPIIMDIDDVPMVGDVTGDGRDDIVIFTADAAADVYVVRSTGSGFAAKVKWHEFFGLTGETLEVADVNADGRDDILTFNQSVNGNNVWVALSTGSSFAASSVWHSYFGIAEEMPGTGDFDGDGDEDIVTFTRSAAADVYVGRSNRAGSFAGALWSDSFGGPRGTYRVGDINGDGRSDILRFTQDSAADVFVRLSTGAGFGVESLWHGYFAP